MAGRFGIVLAAVAVVALAGCGGSKHAEVPHQEFRSRPDLQPPLVRVRVHRPGTAPGYLFLAPNKTVQQSGPLILDDTGQVVWFHPLGKQPVTDFRVQRYRGRPVLTWWRGHAPRGVGSGSYEIVDDHYRHVATVRAGHGLTGDLHEFRITPRNTALLTAYRRVPRDLSPYGGPKHGRLVEGVVQEVDIATGRVLFEWHSLDHVSPAESYAPVPKASKGSKAPPFDYFHVNAIEPDKDGNLLVSGRNTHTIYEISRRDGRILWRLGGKRSDFRLGPDARFAWQHDVRRHPDGTITVFDNGAGPPRTHAQSRALVLRVDERARRTTLVRQYTHFPPLSAPTQGDVQLLPDGHVAVGWGQSPFFTEFTRDGRVLLDLSFGRNDFSYRVLRFPWTGRPADRPAVALDAGKGNVVTLYASWNGATDVRSWQVLTGTDGQHLAAFEVVPKTGFETTVTLDAGGARWFAVEAVNAGGEPLQTSRAVSR